jgi:hypothetical protein
MGVQGHNYSFVLGFEQVGIVLLLVSHFVLLSLQDFEQSSISGWMDTNWIPICSWATAVYLVFIFSVQSYMKDR